MKSFLFSSILFISVQLILADDCNECKAKGKNKFACVGSNSFRFCDVKFEKWIPMGSVFNCPVDQVCSINGNTPCVNETEVDHATCRQVCSTTCRKGDLYTCTAPSKLQICASSPSIKQISCPVGQICTHNFCQYPKVDGVTTDPACQNDITLIDMDKFCENKKVGFYKDPNDYECFKSIKCEYDPERDMLVATFNVDCNPGTQFSEQFGLCVAKRQKGCPPLSDIENSIVS